MNEDETEFLKRVIEAKGDLQEIEKALYNFGEVTDDLTLMKVSFKEKERKWKEEAFDSERIKLASRFYREGNLEQAIQKYEELHQIHPENLDIVKALGKLYIKTKQYKKASYYCLQYSSTRPSDTKFLYYISYALKQTSELKMAAEYGERFRLRNPENIHNLLNLAEIYIMMDDKNKAAKIMSLAEEIDSENPRLHRLRLKHLKKQAQLSFGEPFLKISD
jgi:tetratricopeptide (TPR) repeat protein